MSNVKKEIEYIKTEIYRIKTYIDSKKKSIESLKNDKSRVNDRYKEQIKRADKFDKHKLRNRKKYEIEGILKQVESHKRTIQDYKTQIALKKEKIKKIKSK